MRQLKLVAAPHAAPVAEISGADDRMAQLLGELEQAWDGADRELGVRAARCIRELIQQKEQATALMLESSALLKTALQRLHALRALI
jgi:hypothetical protein